MFVFQFTLSNGLKFKIYCFDTSISSASCEAFTPANSMYCFNNSLSSIAIGVLVYAKMLIIIHIPKNLMVEYSKM